jgi:hypothetical protein
VTLAYTGLGAIVQDSLATSIGSIGEPPNTVRGEFTDEAQNYRLSVIELQAADIGEELLREQTTSLKTIIRLTHAKRALAYALKKTRLVQRRHSWQSPLGALVSEPFDVIRLGHQTPAKRHGYEGFLQAGGTALTLILDQLVPLQAGETYEVILKYQRNNTTVIRTVLATATRNQATLNVAPALPTVPAPGDLCAIGLLGRSMVTVLLDHIEFDTASDTFTLGGSEYRSDVYDTSGTGAIPQTAKAFHDFPALYAEDILPRYHASYLTPPEIGPLISQGRNPGQGRNSTAAGTRTIASTICPTRGHPCHAWGRP